MPVRNAVAAAEGPRLDQGISLMVLARAVWVAVRVAPLEGGSTITQQYVKQPG